MQALYTRLLRSLKAFLQPLQAFLQYVQALLQPFRASRTCFLQQSFLGIALQWTHFAAHVFFGAKIQKQQGLFRNSSTGQPKFTILRGSHAWKIVAPMLENLEAGPLWQCTFFNDFTLKMSTVGLQASIKKSVCFHVNGLSYLARTLKCQLLQTSSSKETLQLIRSNTLSAFRHTNMAIVRNATNSIEIDTDQYWTKKGAT